MVILFDRMGFSSLCRRTCRRNWWHSFSSGVKEKRFAALWGNGDFGRLGLGTVESHWKPTICSTLISQNLISVACGGAHTLFLTENGAVYATGLNDFGQLGILSSKKYVTVPEAVTGISKQVTQISAGYHYSSAITADGELYVWGNNSSGQLGLGRKAPKIVSVPTMVSHLFGIEITMAALGSEHTLALSEEGSLFSWGTGFGRMGHSADSDFSGLFKSKSEYTPRLVKDLGSLKVKHVAAGMLHTACVDENGSVCVFGEGVNLGHQGIKNTAIPSPIPDLPFSLNVACGSYHTCVVTDSGLYTWGSNECGCLGITSSDAAYTPKKVEGPFLNSSVQKVSCGWKHSAAISDGKVFTWGWGGSQGTFSDERLSSAGQLGHGSDVDCFEPTEVEFGKNIKAVQISCGFNHTGAIFEEI